MAIYHISIKVISRGTGQSGVGALAYRSGTSLEDKLLGEQFDYTKKSVMHVELRMPENVPQCFKNWARDVGHDREKVLQSFSNYMEAHETRSDSQIYRELEFALQRELTDEQNMELARAFIDKCCVKKGMVGVLNFHNDTDKKTGLAKFHCHALLSMRIINENGLGLKNREWNRKELHTLWREKWCELVNEKFAELGIDKRIDHRSLKDQGLELKPLPKMSRAGKSMEEKGKKSFREKLFNDTKRQNLFLLQSRPELALEYLTKGQSTFVRDEVLQLVGRYADTYEVMFSLVERIMSSREIVHLEGEEREAVYTTRSQVKLEHSLVEKGEELAGRASHQVGLGGDLLISYFNEKLKEHGGLSQDQIKAIRHITAPGQLKAIEGYAGAGKTTALEVAKLWWEDSNYRVVGLAPTGKAAKNLEGIGVKSFTIDKFEHEVARGRFQYGSNTVIVMDEAGMVDSRRMRSVLQTVDNLGVKLVLVGDGAQLQAIQSGPALRMLLDKMDSVKLETIVRQKTDWQKQATVLFGQNKTREALEIYKQHDCLKLVQEKPLPDLTSDISNSDLIQVGSSAKRMAGCMWHKMREDLKLQGLSDSDIDISIFRHRDFGVFKKWQQLRNGALGLMKEHGLNVNADSIDMRRETMGQMIKDWTQDRQLHADASHIMLANTNRDVNILNDTAREELRKQGIISRDETILRVEREKDLGLGRSKKEYDDVGFSVGDQVIFKKNDTGLGVRNGDLGSIVSLKGKNVQIQLHGHENRQVSFSNNLYPNIRHGWATTIYASQGSTYDYVKEMASFEQYRNLAYVAQTRHRQDLKIYGSQLEFDNEKILIDRLARPKEKLATTDYIKSEQEVEKLVREEGRFFEQAERTFLRVKEGAKAVSHFITGLFVNREEEIKVETYGTKYEPERAIEKLGLADKNIFSYLASEREQEKILQELVVARSKQRELGAGPMMTADLGLPVKDPSSQGSPPNAEPGFEEKKTITSPAPSPRQEKAVIAPATSINLAGQTSPSNSNAKGRAGAKNTKEYIKYDLDHVKSVLKNDGERLATYLLGKDPNQSMSRNGELRYGSKGAFSLQTQGPYAGRWRDFETNEKGDLFELVGKQINSSNFKDRLEYVAQFYGISPEKQPTQGILQDKPVIKEQVVTSPQPSREVELDPTKQQRVNKAYANSRPVEGTLAERYLKEHRKIVGDIPNSMRFIAEYSKDRLPVLVSFAEDENGKKTGLQAIYLDSQTGKKADRENNRLSYGKISGSSVEIKQGSGTLFLAEGVETALSVASVVPKDSAVRATLGVFNLANIKVSKGQQVIICADNDSDKPLALGKDKPPSGIAVEKAVVSLKEQGAEVLVISPEKPGQDFNDVLQIEGKEGVHKAVEKALQQLEQHKNELTNSPAGTTKEEFDKVVQYFMHRQKIREESNRNVVGKLTDKLANQFKEQHGRVPNEKEQSLHAQQADIATKYLLAGFSGTDHITPSLEDTVLASAKREQQDLLERAKQQTAEKHSHAPTQQSHVAEPVKAIPTKTTADPESHIPKAETIPVKQSYAEIVASDLKEKFATINKHGERSLSKSELDRFNLYIDRMKEDKDFCNQVKEANPEIAKDIDKARGMGLGKDYCM